MKPVIPKKLAVVQDISGFGRCSLSVAMPVISACKVQACPIPTAVFSNHTGFSSFYKTDLTSSLPSFFEEWNTLDFHFDGIYCGYLVNTKQIQSITSYIKEVKMQLSDSSNFYLFIDPVMGDHGKLYKGLPDDYLAAMKQFISNADIITPNLTEACLLTDTPYPDFPISIDFLEALIEKLFVYNVNAIVITGILREQNIGNYIYEKKSAQHHFIEVPLKSHSRPGTGDIFASIIFSSYINGYPLLECVKKATDFICICTKASDEAFVPIQEGVIFENYIDLLNTSDLLKHQSSQMS